jgi:beta-phosphoglucomutase
MSFPFKAVLFDFDGVVVLTMDAHRLAWQDLAYRFGLTESTQTLVRFDGCRSRDILKTLLPTLVDETEIVSALQLKEKLYHHHLAALGLRKVEGVDDFLVFLKQNTIPIALATSSRRAHVEHLLTQAKLTRFFETRITAEDVTHGKPHPEVYLKAANALGVSIESCLVIEDAAIGIAAGLKSGASVLGLATTDTPDRLKALGCHMVASDFYHIPIPWLDAVYLPQQP